jgi:gamma-butyrobetaine dioxygenase/trimethyllysine dioxygenase
MADRLEIVWVDGHVSRFPAIWLRHNCVCTECGRTETARRQLRLNDVPRDIAPTQAQVNARGQVVATWNGGNHLSLFDSMWLRAHCLSPVERELRRHKPVVWHAAQKTVLWYQSFPDLQDKSIRLRFLERLRDYGFAILTDVTCEPAATERVASVLGSLRMTNYGIYELISRPAPQLVGDTSVALAPHTDEPYRHSPPGITFFHVLAQSSEGGDSTLVDGFHIANLLRTRRPDVFRLLSTVPIGFHRTLKEGRAFYASGPVIRLDRNGNVEGIRLLDRGTAPFDIPEDVVVPYYDALRELLSFLYDDKNHLVVKIDAGQMLVFNNQRLLHGRTAFDPTASHRHIRSCNVDLDEFYSSLRIAYRELGAEQAYMELPQGAGT